MQTADRQQVNRSGFQQLILQFWGQRSAPADDQRRRKRSRIFAQTVHERLFAIERDTISQTIQSPRCWLNHFYLSGITHEQAAMLTQVPCDQSHVGFARVRRFHECGDFS